MTFTGISFGETDEQEAARLATYPVGSDNHTLADLPVLNHMIEEHVIYELPWSQLHPCPGTPEAHKYKNVPDCGGVHRVIGVAHSRKRGPSKSYQMSERLHDDTWYFKILASDNPVYPAGGYDIVVSESELRRSRVVDLLELLEENESLRG